MVVYCLQADAFGAQQLLCQSIEQRRLWQAQVSESMQRQAAWQEKSFQEREQRLLTRERQLAAAERESEKKFELLLEGKRKSLEEALSEANRQAGNLEAERQAIRSATRNCEEMDWQAIQKEQAGFVKALLKRIITGENQIEQTKQALEKKTGELFSERQARVAAEQRASLVLRLVQRQREQAADQQLSQDEARMLSSQTATTVAE